MQKDEFLIGSEARLDELGKVGILHVASVALTNTGVIPESLAR